MNANIQNAKTMGKILFAGLIVVGSLLSWSGTVAAFDREKAAEKLASLDKTGEFKDCLYTNRIKETDVIDNQNIVFEMRGGGHYLNTLPHKCSQLGFEERFSYNLRGTTRLCDVDIITVITSSGPGSSCGLGKFEKVLQKPKD